MASRLIPTVIMPCMPAQRLVIAGDIININTGPYPIMHRSGSSIGCIATMQTLLAGPIESKAWLRVRLHAAEERCREIETLFEAHKTLEEIKMGLPEPGADARFATFAQTVYEELTRGYPRNYRG